MNNFNYNQNNSCNRYTYNKNNEKYNKILLHFLNFITMLTGGIPLLIIYTVFFLIYKNENPENKKYCESFRNLFNFHMTFNLISVPFTLIDYTKINIESLLEISIMLLLILLLLILLLYALGYTIFYCIQICRGKQLPKSIISFNILRSKN